MEEVRKRAEELTEKKVNAKQQYESYKKVYSYINNPISIIETNIEEQEIINMYQTDFTTYVEEGLAKFFTGVESFDGWDAFVEGANALHYEDIREVKQAQYDRYQEAMK